MLRKKVSNNTNDKDIHIHTLVIFRWNMPRQIANLNPDDDVHHACIPMIVPILPLIGPQLTSTAIAIFFRPTEGLQLKEALSKLRGSCLERMHPRDGHYCGSLYISLFMALRRYGQYIVVEFEKGQRAMSLSEKAQGKAILNKKPSRQHDMNYSINCFMAAPPFPTS